MKLARTLIATVVLAALAACGDKPADAPAATPAPTTTTAAPEPAAAPASPAEPAATAVAAAPSAEVGKATYGKVCAMCHAAGVAGAPKPGDKAAWAPRIAQGPETLYKHAIEGFTGSQGMMPAKGGGMSLSDDEVKAAVDHMVALSK